MAKSDPNIFPAGDWRGKKIGLLGGSFNPAHGAHLELTLAALDKLQLDAVWWLVSPQNPLKSRDDMADLQDRMESATAVATDSRIYVTNLENDLKTCYTAETLARMTSLLPDAHFVWLMGADNLAQFSAWKDWKKIAETVVFAIFDRPGYSEAALASEAAEVFRDCEIPVRLAADLATRTPPAWTFIREIKNPLSSTEIRRKNFNNQEVKNKLPSNNISEDDVSSSAEPHSSKTLLEVIITSLEDDKAEEIISIDLKGKTSIADSMVIASGRSTRQVAAIATHLVTNLKKSGYGNSTIEGLEKSDWVLIDAGDAIIHIFRPEVRSFYNLEKMWNMEISPDDFTPDKMLSR
ncbi:MAG: nicotinate-nucleotide adenylyltransferase [Emcibacter sp.]|nr:nicotinate-nucleotide adenylyltransferase [Emcibacter sp.]